MKNLYGNYTIAQIQQIKNNLRKNIFFFLLYVDPKTAGQYKNVDVTKSIEGLLYKLGGLNELLLCQPELVDVMSLLQAALIEYNNPQFHFQIYRKLVLDAGATIMKLKEE